MLNYLLNRTLSNNNNNNKKKDLKKKMHVEFWWSKFYAGIPAILSQVNEYLFMTIYLY